MRRRRCVRCVEDAGPSAVHVGNMRDAPCGEPTTGIRLSNHLPTENCWRHPLAQGSTKGQLGCSFWNGRCQSVRSAVPALCLPMCLKHAKSSLCHLPVPRHLSAIYPIKRCHAGYRHGVRGRSAAAKRRCHRVPEIRHGKISLRGEE